MKKVDKVINKLLSNNVTIKFYMIGTLMKSEILGYVNSEIVVTKGSVGSGNRKMQILKKVLNHCSSHVRDAKARYSTLEEDRETMVCFLDFQVTKEVPKKIQYLETERR